MYLKLIAGLALAAASTLVFAVGNEYEVTFKGEAPMRLTLDGKGLASTASVAQVEQKPAIQFDVAATDVTGETLSLNTRVRTPVLEHLTSANGDDIHLPGIVTASYFVFVKLQPGERAVVTAAPTGNGEQLVTLRRLN